MVVPVVFLEYEFNKEYIIDNYCVNKNKPALHCDGKCYLAKKIKTAEQNEEQQAKANIFKLLVEVFHSHTPTYEILHGFCWIKPLTHPAYKDTYHYLILFSILKPPQLS